jgi:hypothetical protein
MYNCPNCDIDLVWDDYYGEINGFDKVLNIPTYKKEGDIYKCDECDGVFHAACNTEELKEGYPC